MIVGKEKRSANDIPEEVDAIFEDGETDSRLRAAELFRWLIFPVDPEIFFEEYWEKKPLIIQRNKQTDGEGKDYYKVSHNLSYHVSFSIFNQGWFGTKALEEILLREKLSYVEHVDVSKYEAGKKQEMVVGGKVEEIPFSIFAESFNQTIQ